MSTPSATRQVEVYVGFTDRTWDTAFVEIPRDTPEDEIERVAVEVKCAQLNAAGTATAFVGLYHAGDDEEVSDGEDESED